MTEVSEYKAQLEALNLMATKQSEKTDEVVQHVSDLVAKVTELTEALGEADNIPEDILALTAEVDAKIEATTAKLDAIDGVDEAPVEPEVPTEEE